MKVLRVWNNMRESDSYQNFFLGGWTNPLITQHHCITLNKLQFVYYWSEIETHIWRHWHQPEPYSSPKIQRKNIDKKVAPA